MANDRGGVRRSRGGRRSALRDRLDDHGRRGEARAAVDVSKAGRGRRWRGQGGARPRPPMETKARTAVEGVAARRCSQPMGNSARARRRGAGSGEGAKAVAWCGLSHRSSSGSGRRSCSGVGGRARAGAGSARAGVRGRTRRGGRGTVRAGAGRGGGAATAG
ncbi:uncharacterized protein [Miscanthus floridulus]|uniref:uncharacterized protein n=1 Tax=Miscanthus floridulus TaxID=154761 RepID=UPI0034585734